MCVCDKSHTLTLMMWKWIGTASTGQELEERYQASVSEGRFAVHHLSVVPAYVVGEDEFGLEEAKRLRTRP